MPDCQWALINSQADHATRRIPKTNERETWNSLKLLTIHPEKLSNNSFKMVVNFKVFKKCSPNNMITLYMNRREFVDSVTQVEPIGRYHKRIQNMGKNFYNPPTYKQLAKEKRAPICSAAINWFPTLMHRSCDFHFLSFVPSPLLGI